MDDPPTLARGPSHAPLAWVIWMMLGLAPGSIATAEATVLENAVKADYLIKLPPFVAWPSGVYAGPNSPFNLCIVGPDALGEILDRAARHQQVSGHPVVIHRMTRMEDLGACHLAYIRSGPGQSAGAVLRALADRPVLTVTDDGAEARGAILRFVLSEGRVKFVVDIAAAQAAGLTISSKLLSLAVSTRGGAS